MIYLNLTLRQKLAAMSLRFYQGLVWHPKPGDYYTTSRDDVELYRIAKIEGGRIFTERCERPGELTQWPEAGFTSEDFGLRRVWVPPFVLEVTE